MDDIARSTLKASNQALSASIDQYLQGVSSKIALLDKTTSSQVGNISSTNILDRTSYNKEYRNYYFGTPADTITRPEQCTIARWYSGDISEYWRSVSVEANAAFDINSTQGHINLLKTDTEELVKLQKLSSYSCFDPSTSQAKLDSYWWWNSILSVTNKKNSWSPDDFLFGTSPISAFTGFSLPIFSLWGMKESSRITTPSIANCINSKYQYTLLQPYKYTYTVDYWVDASQTQLCTAWWPDEWNRPAWYCGQDIGNRTPRFTCNTTHIVWTWSSISESLRDYTTGNCLSWELWVDGKALKKATKTCIVSTPGTESIDGSTIDTTLYENRYYHTIPSIWSHTSPTDSEILAAEANKVTPSLAIDQIRFVEFLTPKWNIARINYPNFFELQWSDIMPG
jgi:hypothetical protein